MRYLLLAIIVLMGLITINELAYIGETSLAFVIMAIAISIGILAYAQIQNIKDKK